MNSAKYPSLFMCGHIFFQRDQMTKWRLVSCLMGDVGIKLNPCLCIVLANRERENKYKHLIGFVYGVFMNSKSPVNCFVWNHQYFEKFAKNQYFRDAPENVIYDRFVYIAPSSYSLLIPNVPFIEVKSSIWFIIPLYPLYRDSKEIWGCFLMSEVRMLHFSKVWYTFIQIHQYHTIALKYSKCDYVWHCNHFYFWFACHIFWSCILTWKLNPVPFFIFRSPMKCICYTGWPRKKRNDILPTVCGYNNWYQCIWENFSSHAWEKLYQDQQFWFSSLLSTAHFVE